MALLAMRVELQGEVGEAEDQQRRLSAQRKAEEDVKSNIASLRDMIESRGTGQEYVDSLRNTMDTVENDIFSVRQGHHSKVEALSAEEQQLTDAVAAIEAEIVDWLSFDDTAASKQRPATAGTRPSTSTHQNGAVQTRSKVAAMINQPQLPPEVVAVDRILKEHGGSTGGWDDTDHERFLRYRTQFKGQPHVFCAKTAEDLVDHDIASVERHEIWYVRYLSLLEEKKAAIRSWRSNKHSHALLDDIQGDAAGAAHVRARPSTAVEGRRDSSGVSREEQKEKLKKWKDEREVADAEAKKKKEEEEAVQQQKKKEKITRERGEQKRRISNYKNSKEAEEERKKQEEEERLEFERDKTKISADQLERIRLRNKQMTDEHTNLVRRKAEEERLKAERMESLRKETPGPEVERDPSRLTALTAASVAKRDARLKQDGEPPERPGYFAIMRPTLTHNPTRAVPSWRAGV
eukprot:CAMPEP_0179406676 /NCGR_PEP_ID=MMETSP0799-20121207/1036_1 /TAXON_ID=46947 /ORGANISM="Geminigera cryophila, Strain CCMP2564" /LENGTH=462 /DNA_ID=CAMNT_0021177785 /DNA_START=72 /DNA_END=1461 /DNA_ORIENTATION=+